MAAVSVFQPKVSIIIPVYNGSDYLKEAIDSALGQTYGNIEVIVVNDGSNDGGKTQAIISSYGNRIRPFNKPNEGVASALNLGIDQMTGEYFSWLSHDDKYLPNKISSQMKKILQTGNKWTIIYSGYQIINEYGSLIGEFRPSSMYPIGQCERSLFPVLRLLINGCTLLFHKDHFKRVGGFNIQLRTTQDYDMWFRLFRNQMIVYCEEIGVLNRNHKGQGSKNNIAFHVQECEQLWLKMLSSLTVDEINTLDGNGYLFFIRTYDMLKSRTLYYKTMQYAQRRAYEERGKLLRQGNAPQNNVGNAMAVSKPAIGDKKKTRVAFLASEKNGKGGLMKMLERISKELSVYYEVFIFYINNVMGQEYEFDGTLFHVKVETGIRWEEKMASKAESLGIDVFIGCHNCMSYALTLYSAMKKHGIKCVAWNHEDYYFPRVNRTFYAIGEKRKAVFHQLDGVVWINKVSKVAYDKEGNNGVYIPNYVELPQVFPAIKPKKTPTLISAGRYQDRIKRIDRLLEVLSFASVENPTVKLYIIGDNCMDTRLDVLNGQTVRERMQLLGIGMDKVIFTGWLKDLSSYYQNARIQLCTSESEGFGLVIPEAAIYGVPTIAFANGGAESIIVNGQNGYVVNSTSEMLSAIRLLMTDRKLYEYMQHQCVSMCKAYNKESVIGKWKALIDGLVQNNTQLLNSLIYDQEIRNNYGTFEIAISNRNKELGIRN